jgi:hypothetical protein
MLPFSESALVVSLSAVAHFGFATFAAFVAFQSLRAETRPDYLPALVAGLVGFAVAPILMFFVLHMLGIGPPKPPVSTFFSGAPMEIANGLLRPLPAELKYLNVVLVSVMRVGLHVGFFAAVYLAVVRRRKKRSNA